MKGFNEMLEGEQLHSLIHRSQEWVNMLNEAIKAYHQPKATEEQKEEAVLNCLRVAENVLAICCENRLCLDFFAKEPDGIRHSFDMLAAKEIRCPSKAQTADGEESKVKLHIQASLPENAPLEVYEQSCYQLMRILPMYEAIGFSMAIVRGIRSVLSKYEDKRAAGREWTPLTAWKSRTDEALKACKGVCTAMLDARKKAFRTLQHPMNPRKGISQKGCWRYLDLFDNEYSVLSVLAQAETEAPVTLAPANPDDSLRIPAAVTQSLLCPGQGKPPAPESILLAVGLWNQMEDMGIDESKRSEQWICISQANALGIYGDRRIAAARFLDTVESDQRSSRRSCLIETMHMVANTVQARLTPLACSILSGERRAVQISSILAARIWKSLRTQSSEDAQTTDDSGKPEETAKGEAKEEWFTVQKGDSLQLHDLTGKTLTLDSALWSALLYEWKQGRQHLLEIHNFPDNENALRIALTSAGWSRYNQYQQGHAATASGDTNASGQADGQTAGKNSGQTDGSSAELCILNRTGNFSELVTLIAGRNQQPDSRVEAAVEAMKALRQSIQEADMRLAIGDTWMEDADLSLHLASLETAMLPSARNDAYLTLHNLAGLSALPAPRKKKDRQDPLILLLMQNIALENSLLYAHAVLRIAGNACSYIQHILQCKMEIEPDNLLAGNNRYSQVALKKKRAQIVRNNSSATWWMTRVMRNVLAYTYGDSALTPPFKAAASIKEADDWDELLSRPCNESDSSDGSLQIRDAICQKMSGKTYAELKKLLSVPSPDLAFLKKEQKQEAYLAFCQEMDKREYFAVTIPSEKQNMYSIRIVDESLRPDSDMKCWIDGLGQDEQGRPLADAWMQDEKKRELFIRCACKQWLDRLCSQMTACRRKQLKGENAFDCSLLNKKKRALDIVLIAASMQLGDAGLSIKELTTTPYVHGKENDLRTNLKAVLNDRTQRSFDDLCGCLFKLQAGDQEKYKEFLACLASTDMTVKTTEYLGENGLVSWRINLTHKKQA